MSIDLVLPSGYGYVVLAGIFTILVQGYLGILVSRARKRFEVPYPTMYDNAKPAFNNVQRGHQNMLESHYFVIWLLSIAGLKHPLAAAGCAVGWGIGRIVYAWGYANKPESRGPGAGISVLFVLGILGLAVWQAISWI